MTLDDALSLEMQHLRSSWGAWVFVFAVTLIVMVPVILKGMKGLAWIVVACLLSGFALLGTGGMKVAVSLGWEA